MTTSSTTNNDSHNGGDSSGDWLDDNFPLHRAVFQNDIKQLAQTLRNEQNNPMGDPNREDTHGNTPLHLAAMLGNIEAAKLLLANGARVGAKNNDGWKSLHEAISYGNRKMIGILLVAHKRQSHQSLTSRLPELNEHLSNVADFYMEIKWEFQSWIPLLSKIMPSDTFKLFKRGPKLRIDFTLIDFNERLFSWIRGDMSLLFDPTAEKGSQTLLMDNQKGVFQWVRDKNRHLDDELDMLMSSDIVSSHMSTRPIQFIRAKNWFKGNVSSTIGEYKADLYHIKGMCLINRRRREHLSTEDVKKNRELNRAMIGEGTTWKNDKDAREAIKQGKTYEEFLEWQANRKNLTPPPEPALTWAQYLRVPDGPLAHLGRPKQEKMSTREVKGMVAVSEDFPLTLEYLLDILQVLEPVNPKTINKLRTFCSSGRLPAGFPVQIEIPVIATLSMKLTSQHFEWRDPKDSFAPELFVLPSYYREEPGHFRNL